MTVEPRYLELLQDPAFVADLESDDPIRAVAVRWEVTFGFVQRYRAKDGRPKHLKLEMAADEPPPANATQPEGHRATWTGTEGEMFVVIHETMTHEAILKKFGHDTDETRIVGVLEETHWQFGGRAFNHRYKFKTQRRDPVTGEWPELVEGEQVPRWPVVQPARTEYLTTPVIRTPKASRYKTAVVGADTQIGFDFMQDGSTLAYHDIDAIDVFIQILAIENPHKTALAGDIFDLTEQSRWPQQSGFARSTQPSLDYGRELAARMRNCTDGEINWIEGNHDKRMSSFMETNAMASMNLKRSGYPDTYPVMSIPNLVGLEDFGVDYTDAYPAGAYWINDSLRVIHGTKANAAGSTASQYANATPHISTCFGHTHRQEVQAKTVFDRQGKIKTMNFNPGCLCRVDGAVPSVHGARKLDGTMETYWENWQQGVSVIRYHDDGSFYVEQVQIEDGVTMHLNQEIRSAFLPVRDGRLRLVA